MKMSLLVIVGLGQIILSRLYPYFKCPLGAKQQLLPPHPLPHTLVNIYRCQLPESIPVPPFSNINPSMDM